MLREFVGHSNQALPTPHDNASSNEQSAVQVTWLIPIPCLAAGSHLFFLRLALLQSYSRAILSLLMQLSMFLED